MENQTHILIVDDVSENIQIAMNILQEDGYGFSFAIHGTEALELIDSSPNKFDLILLDIMMPGIDGFEVCRKLKQNINTNQIPIIFLSAKVDVDSIKEGFLLGAVDYVTKPFHPEELLVRVRNHIQLYQSKRLLQQYNISLEAKMKYGHERLFSELEENQKDMIFVLAELMEFTSDETGRHIKRVAEISALFAKQHPAMNEEDEELLYHASPMHDIGKMMIPQEILHKPGKLTEAEFDIMKTHTTSAYNLLNHSERKFMKAAAIISYEHHEKWNGEGYPRHLKGEEIHIYGRIVAIADVLDALTHKRCYKDAWEMDSVIEYIQQHRGSHFDPELVDILMSNLSDFIEIIQKN